MPVWFCHGFCLHGFLLCCLLQLNIVISGILCLKTLTGLTIFLQTFLIQTFLITLLHSFLSTLFSDPLLSMHDCLLTCYATQTTIRCNNISDRCNHWSPKRYSPTSSFCLYLVASDVDWFLLFTKDPSEVSCKLHLWRMQNSLTSPKQRLERCIIWGGRSSV